MSPGGGHPVSSASPVDTVGNGDDEAVHSIGEALNFSATGSPIRLPSSREGSPDGISASHRASRSSGLITPQPIQRTPSVGTATPPPMLAQRTPLDSRGGASSRQQSGTSHDDERASERGSAPSEKNVSGSHQKMQDLMQEPVHITPPASVVAKSSAPRIPSTVVEQPRQTERSRNVSTLQSGSSQPHPLYTFQKRSMRHSRQNWKSTHTMDNAQCLPQPDDSVLHALARLQGRHVLQPIPVCKRNKHALASTGDARNKDDSTPPPPPTTSVVAPEAQSAIKDDHVSAAHDELQSPQQHEQPGQDTKLSWRQQGSSSSRLRTPSIVFSRTTTPAAAGELQTSVIASHAHPPGLLANRPPSQMALTELLLSSPPSTASRMLSRNLLGLTLTSRDGFGEGTLTSSTPDRRLAAAFDLGMSGKSSAGGQQDGRAPSFQAGSSIIGSLRPNSVMSRLPPIVSTSMGGAASPSVLDGQAQHLHGGGVQGSGRPPKGTAGDSEPNHSVPKGNKQRHNAKLAQRPTVTNGDGIPLLVGDPEEALGGAMFAASKLPVSSTTTTAAVSAMDRQHNAVLTPMLQVLETTGGPQLLVDQSAWPSSDGTPALGPIKDAGTPHRLKTFGLKKPPLAAVPLLGRDGLPRADNSRGASAGENVLDFSSYESLLGPQWQKQSTYELQLLQHPQQHDHEEDSEDIVGSPMGRLAAAAHRRQRQQQRPLEVVSYSPSRGSPSVALSPQPLLLPERRAGGQQIPQAKPQRCFMPRDPIERVQRVCEWGYDLRSLFLVQLARDGLSLPRFVASLSPSAHLSDERNQRTTGGQSQEVTTSIEAWVHWLEWGGSKVSDVPHLVEMCSNQRLAGKGPRARVTGSKEKQIRELEAVILAACEYVASTLFRGRKNDGCDDSNKCIAGHHPTSSAAPVVHEGGQQASGEDPSRADLDRVEVRRVLAEQGLQIGDVCIMFRHVLMVGMSQETAQQLLKRWLMDPAMHSPKIETCMRQFMGTVDHLRDVFMECLEWNRQERETHVHYLAVLDEAYHIQPSYRVTEGASDDVASHASTRSGVVAALGTWSSTHRAQLEEERSTLIGLMEHANASILYFRRLASHNPQATEEEPPETVETFCAMNYLSLSDVCAWLARAPTFDRNILSHVWSYVIAHKSQRARRSEPLDILPVLEALLWWEEGDGVLTPGERTAAIVEWGERVRRTCMVSSSTATKNAATTRTAAPQHRGAGAKRIPQDRFVLETVIGQLRLHDAEDRHNAALHAASPMIGHANTDKNKDGGWRKLARNVAVHRELVFRQNAELLKNVVKRRAEAHHRSDFQKLQAAWRTENDRNRMDGDDEERRLRDDPENTTRAITTTTTTEHHYRPKCQDTLESFLSIQGLATDRLPLGLIEQLHESLM